VVREGKSASNIAEAMRSIISANQVGASEIKDSDLQRMNNIDQEAIEYLQANNAHSRCQKTQRFI
jgi:hypothetical protein